MRTRLPNLVLETIEKEPSHGYPIAQAIKHSAPGLLDGKEATLYAVLRELEDDGSVCSQTRMEEGRVRRYYSLTDKGHRVLAHQRESPAKMPLLVLISGENYA